MGYSICINKELNGVKVTVYSEAEEKIILDSTFYAIENEIIDKQKVVDLINDIIYKIGLSDEVKCIAI